MKPSKPAATTGRDRPLYTIFLNDLAGTFRVPEARQHSFKEAVQRAAREFQEGQAVPKVGAIRKEITSLAKAIAKVLNKPTQKKREVLRRLAACKKLRPRFDKLSPEAIEYLLRHRPPHDRSNPPWKSNEFDWEDLEDLYARCCVFARTKGENGNPLSKLDVKYGPVKEPKPPLDHPKRTLYAQLGLAFHEAKGTYPNRADIVRMVDYVLEKLGEPAKQDRDNQDTHMAREYLRLLKEPHNTVPPSRATAKGKRQKKARDRLTRMREKLLPVFEAELVGKKCVRRGDEWHEALSIIYEPDTNAFYVIYEIPAVIGQWTEKKELPPSFTKAAIEKLYG